MLHHLSREDAFAVLQRMQEHTNVEGLHAITVFTNKGELSDKHKNQFYPGDNELKELYESAGWEIVEYKISEVPALDEKPDGSPMLNTTAELLAWRTK